MPDVTIFHWRAARRAARRAALVALPLVTLWLASCSSTKIEGVPEKLPEIALSGSTATPPHHMATYEYPFDSNGNYVSDWAAEGEARAGRSRRATPDDESNWSGSHRGRVTVASTPKKSAGGKPKAKSSDDEARPKKKSPATPAKSAKSKSGGGSKYVVKKGDSVERIARRYGISVAKLKAANGLKSDLIRDGQALSIPK
jgi:LysM repeat protein